MVLGEGAATLVVEELSAAEARGASIYGEIVAASSSFVAGRRLVARRDKAMANALGTVLQSAGIDASQLGHFNAHGLSTRSCDVEEARAVGEVFGQRATTLPVVAAKANFGNLGAAGGLIELIGSLMAMQHGRLFPALNYETPDPACPLAVVTEDDVDPGESFVALNVTPQGQAASVVVRRFV
jgi:3-oxoacyl-[acyl-carrier-protein] synthase II